MFAAYAGAAAHAVDTPAGAAAAAALPSAAELGLADERDTTRKKKSKRSKKERATLDPHAADDDAESEEPAGGDAAESQVGAAKASLDVFRVQRRAAEQDHSLQRRAAEALGRKAAAAGVAAWGIDARGDRDNVTFGR
jgi:hypothetical protein